MNRIIFNERERIGDWAKDRIGHIQSWGEWYQSIGLERDGALIAAVVFNYYSDCDIAMHIAAMAGKRWLNRDYLKTCFSYPFVQLGVRRVTGYVPEKNLEAQKFDEHLGFIREGLMRNAIRDDNVIIYGLLKEHCRFL